MIKKNADGTRTYNFVASDIQRGIDVFSWTGRPNPVGAKPPASGQVNLMGLTDAGLLMLGLLGLPVAALVGRRRRRSS